MAVNTLTNQSYDAGFQWPTPVPTPNPPVSSVVPIGSGGYQVNLPSGGYSVQSPQSLVASPGGTATVNTPQGDTTANVGSPGGSESGFDMKYYPGWDPTAAREDWKATGGSKANTSGGGSAPAPQTYNIRGTSVTGNNPTEALQSVLPNSDYGNYASQFNPEEFLASIDKEYGAQEQFLGQQESALKAAEQAYNKQIEADYGANLAKGKASKETALGTLGQNQVTAQQQKQDALNSAKQLYNQLQSGYRQRFGGATSAGEAAQTILGEEQQRQSGLIGRDYINTVNQIEGQKAEVQRNYDAAVLDLQAQKQQSMNQVRDNMMTQLGQINNNRTMAIGAREQAKRDLILRARDEAFAIEQSNMQFKQQLEMMKQQAQIQLDANMQAMQQQVAGNAQAGANIAGAYGTKYSNVTSNLGQNNQPVTSSVQQSQPQNVLQSVGQVSQSPRNVDEFWQQYG